MGGRVARQGEGKTVSAECRVLCQKAEECVCWGWGGVESAGGGAGDARPRLPAPAHLRVRHNCKWQQCHNEDTGGDQITLSQHKENTFTFYNT